MSITTITSLSQLNDILTKAEGKLAVIDFHATWCALLEWLDGGVRQRLYIPYVGVARAR